MDRDAILDIGMQMLAGGASLEDVVAAAAEYGVNLYDVYYSDPGTTFEITTPDTVDTTPPPQEPVYVEPTPEPVYVPPPTPTYNYQLEAQEKAGIGSLVPTAAVSQQPSPLTDEQLIAIGEAQNAARTGYALTPEEKAALQNKIETIAGRPVTTEENINAHFAYDKKVTADAETALRISAGIDAVDDRYDVNNDGQVNSLDSLLIAKGTPVLTDAEVAQQKQVDEAVTTALQNGFSKEEVSDIAKELNIPEDTITKSFNKVVGSQSAADIILGVSALSGKNQTLTYEKIVKYADDNKLPYIDVAAALKDVLKGQTQDSILDAMVYQKDYEKLSPLFQTTDKGTTVDQNEAIAQAIKSSISFENLAKMLGKTDAQLTTYINNNLGNVADTLRKNNIAPEDNLSAFANIKAEDTTSAINRLDADALTTKNLQAASENGLTLNEILNEIDRREIGIEDFVNQFFGSQDKLVTQLSEESKYTPEQRVIREEYNDFAKGFSKESPMSYKDLTSFIDKQNLTDDAALKILNLEKSDLDSLNKYRRDTFITEALNELEKSDNRLDYSEIIDFAKQNRRSVNNLH